MIHFTLRMIVILIETIKDLYQTRLAKDGGTVRTIRGGCDYMTGMGKQRELRSHWQRVCKLILAKTDVGRRQQGARAGVGASVPHGLSPL